MKVSTLFRRLSFSEFSNLSIGQDGSGNIRTKDQSKVINHINEGLKVLYTRFVLNEKFVLVQTVDYITNYHLRFKYAESSQSEEPVKYIKDMMADPFMDDVLKIMGVTDSNGLIRVLNDTENSYSLFTPSPDTLQVPYPVNGQGLMISYQANHYLLRDDIDNKENQDIDLPQFLETALQSYVAHLVYSAMNGQENLIKSQECYSKFENECLRVEDRDLVNNTFATSHQKLEQRGFV